VPELPEVETVRRGLADHVVHRTVTDVEVLRERAVRRHPGGAVDLAARLRGARLGAAVRRGKYLWLPLDRADDAEESGEALLIHLGMSGQVLVKDGVDGTEGLGSDAPHLRVRLTLADGGEVWFVDQRTFGHLVVADLVPTADGGPGGVGSSMPALPQEVAHIARDLLDPGLAAGTPGRAALLRRLRSRRTGIKRALLDQTLVSGVGNIYADEGLWRARVHYAQEAATMSRARTEALLEGVAEVMRGALAVGGTSFDSLYVNVNGASGYFDRSLVAYGQAGRPCARCGTPIVREPFMNRSSFRCPRCQRAPRHG
jgi:formamidopyrimidine-DNA glycosylase